MKRLMDNLSKLGRSLMLPIAVLPVAALLLRLGQPDLLSLAPVAAAGDAIFGNLGILFAIGIAVGLARENHGAAGLAGAVAYFIATEGTKAFISVPAEVVAGLPDAHASLAAAAYKLKQIRKASVPIGILSGIAAGWLYNRYSDIKLPDYLAFFAGRRFVPIVAGLAGLGLAFAFGLGWPFVERGMDAMSHAIIESGSVGLLSNSMSSITVSPIRKLDRRKSSGPRVAPTTRGSSSITKANRWRRSTSAPAGI